MPFWKVLLVSLPFETCDYRMPKDTRLPSCSSGNYNVEPISGLTLKNLVLEALASRLEAIAFRLESIAIRLGHCYSQCY